MGNVIVTDLPKNQIESLFQGIQWIKECLESKLEGNNFPADPFSTKTENLPLKTLCHKFGLSNFERNILLLCVGMLLDPTFAELCAKVQGNPQLNYPTFSLALRALPSANFSIFFSESPLKIWQLIEVSQGLTPTSAPIKIDERIFCYLLGENSFDELLKCFTYDLPDKILEIPLSSSQEKIVEEMTISWLNVTNEYPILQLSGFDSLSKYRLAWEVTRQLNCQLKVMSASLIPNDCREMNHFKQRWERESLLSNTILLLDCDEISSNDPKQLICVNLFIENLLTPVIISTEERIKNKHRSVITWEVPNISYQEQRLIWENNLSSISTELNGEISQLSSLFNLTPNLIQTACNHVKKYYFQQEKNQVNPLEIQAQLWHFCRTQSRPKLEDLAQRIDDHASWNDLILPDKQKQILREMEAHLKYKSKIYEDWGFGSREKRGLGVTALFSGQSGTGKTMAAGVIAKTLNLDLYRIDLSTVVSKYIGETEKNLRKIFDAAETGGCILLFDEADALFGKRTEVKDSHDRHANVEVSYLLQRMEAYQGLAILTTNLKSSLDQAFLRRIRFVIPFPFPDEDSRSEIWKRAFPAKTPTKDLDFWRLGALNVAGGNIKNIAINAAVLAAQEDQPIRMKHILKATQAEYVKLERTLTAQEINGWV